MIGQTLGSYRIIAEVGRGGMAAVYRGVHVQRGFQVAVKVLSPQLAQDPEFSRRFLREMETLRNLRHRHIVTLYEAGQDQGVLYMAMELLDGGSLEQRITGGRTLDVATVVAVLAQVAEALDYAHHRGVIHRDVKPANILFDHSGRAVLSDFGIAKEAGHSSLTHTGAAVGTPAYSSPEQARGLRRLDGRADVYSLGVVAYRLLTGRVPFERENPLAVLLAHVQDTPTPPRQLNRSLNTGVEAVILRALSKTPGQRYDSAGQFVRVLAAVARGSAISSAVRRGGGLQMGRVWPALAAVTALLGVALVAAFANGSRSGSAIIATPPPSAAGPLIAFESDRDGNKEIYLAHPSGKPVWRLTKSPGLDFGPAWSPDGAWIAFASDRAGFMDIYVVKRTGGELRNLTQSSAQDSGPAWSPDGVRLAFDTDRDGNLEVYVTGLDGGSAFNLTQNPASDGDPSWSPDGAAIAFESDRDGNFEIYVLPSKGGPAQRLTSHSGKDFAPAFSPDGRRIVFQCERDGAEICVMDADGGQQRRLTMDQIDDLQPGWSPDGRQIIWTRVRPDVGLWQLYVMDVDGRNMHLLWSTRSSDTAPVWTD